MTGKWRALAEMETPIGICEAPVEDIATTVGFTMSLAANVKEYL